MERVTDTPSQIFFKIPLGIECKMKMSLDFQTFVESVNSSTNRPILAISLSDPIERVNGLQSVVNLPKNILNGKC